MHFNHTLKFLVVSLFYVPSINLREDSIDGPLFGKDVNISLQRMGSSAAIMLKFLFSTLVVQK